MLHLTIEDSIFNPFHQGVMLLSNDQALIEKSPSPYVFLGNGRDVLDIEIIPLKNGNFDRDSTDERNKEFLGLRFSFVITEAVDTLYNDIICKKLVFVEYSQYMMAENICNIFALQKAGGLVGNYMETNGGNSKSTGEIITAILNAVYNDGKPSEELFFKDQATGQKIFEDQSESKLNSLHRSPVGYQLVEFGGILALLQLVTQTVVTQHFSNFRQNFKVLLGGSFWHQQKNHQRHRLFIGCIKPNRVCQQKNRRQGIFHALDTSMRNGHAVT
jgi:hypothetical protein